MGNAISNENPSFVAGDDGGRGSRELPSPRAADFVSVPIATFVTTGASQVLRCCSLVRPALFAPMAALRKISLQALLWDRVRRGKAVAKREFRNRATVERAASLARPFTLQQPNCIVSLSGTRSQPLGIEYSA
jgi:hypothetical protein